MLFDTDIGTDVDDAFALALILASPELELRGVTTVGGGAEDRAWMVCRFLTSLGREKVPVAWGRKPQPDYGVNWQIQYRRHPAVVWDRTSKPAEEPAVELLYRQLKRSPGELTIIAVGPLTNVARLIGRHPECKPWIQRIVLMGGSVHRGYEGNRHPEAEWNIRSDVEAAQAVFASGVPLVVAPLDATAHLKLDKALRQRLFEACSPLTFQVQSLYELWEQETPTLYDPLAVALAIGERFSTMKDLRLRVDEKGFTRIAAGEPNARVALETQKERFLSWYIRRVSSPGRRTLPDPPGNETKTVEPGGLPGRVHAFEDYETDIEKRWWMAGKLETADVPPGSRRACRAVLTQDFDARMGNTRTMYRAVIFNPVPGPPMGSSPRLRFRYKLRGTDTIRVQLFSLSRGYHRYLSIKNVPQGRWTTAAVDMTDMRRPDGSGGPLSADERIDDIQFSVDPRAELLIDDIVLYDAAPESETRPFPERILFTGWFDTGRQGREWPGDFEIVRHEKPRTWKAARSVRNEKLEVPWLRIHLRGERPAAEKLRLRFRYRLTGEQRLRAVLLDSKTGAEYPAAAATLPVGRWAEATFDFRIPTEGKRRFVDELRLIGRPGAELLVDDLLLYVPGRR